MRMLRVIGVLLALCACGVSGLAVGMSVTPSTIDSLGGVATVEVTGLTNGQSILLEEYQDRNANGTADFGEPMVQCFRLTDGAVASIGATRNRAVPGDDDGAQNGAVRAVLSLAAFPLSARVAAHYLFLVRSDSGGSLVWAPLVVTPHEYGQAVTGTVTGPLGEPIGGACVSLEDTQGGSVQLAAVSDATGVYRVSCPPGRYRVTVTRDGYTAGQGWEDLETTVLYGATVTRNFTLGVAPRRVLGRLVDAVTGEALAGAEITAAWSLPDGSATSVPGFTDRYGAFNVAAAADAAIGLQVDSAALALRGYLPPVDGFAPVDTRQGNATGIVLRVTRATALIHGVVAGSDGVGLGGVTVTGYADGVGYASALTDATGAYCLAVLPGEWNLGADEAAVRAHGCMVTEPFTEPVAVAAGETGERNFTFATHTCHLRGVVTDDAGAPVPGIAISAGDESFANWLQATTAADGSFDFPVTGGTWTLSVNDLDAIDHGLYGTEPPAVSVMDGVDTNGTIYRLRRPTAHLRGQVVVRVAGASDTPLPGVPIAAYLNTGEPTYSSYYLRTVTDATGHFDLGVVAGTLDVYLENESHPDLLWPGMASYEIVDGVNQEGIVLVTLGPTAHITGTVRDAAGALVPRVTVLLMSLDSDYATTVYTDAEGAFRLPAIAGEWALSAYSMMPSITWESRLVTVDTADVVVDLQEEPRYEPSLQVKLDGEDYLWSSTASSTAGTTAAYMLQLSNAGNLSDTFTLKEDGTPVGVATSYTDVLTGQDISDAVHAGTWGVELAPGAKRLVRMVVTLGPEVAVGTSCEITVQATASQQLEAGDNIVITMRRKALEGISLEASPAKRSSVGAPVVLHALLNGWSADAAIGFLVDGTPLAPASAAETLTWTPQAAGSYTLSAQVQDALAGVSYTSAPLTYTVTAPLASVKLTANPSASAPAGTLIRLQGAPQGGTTVEYRFLGRLDSAKTYTELRGWGDDLTFTGWQPAIGRHVLYVQAREKGTTRVIDSPRIYLSVRAPLTSATVSGYPSSPTAVDSKVILSTEAVGGTGLEYRFAVTNTATGETVFSRDWYYYRRTWWYPQAPGHYLVTTEVRDKVDGTQVAATTEYEVLPKLSALKIELVTPRVAAPYTTAVGVPVKALATATGGGSLEYRYVIGYRAKLTDSIVWDTTRAYGPARQLNDFTPTAPGYYYLRGHVREIPSAEYFQLRSATDITVEVKPAVTDIALQCAPATEARVGEPITLTASGTGGAHVEWKIIGRRVGTSTWFVIKDYSESPTCTDWHPDTPGTYKIALYAREVGSKNTVCDVKNDTYTYTIIAAQ